MPALYCLACESAVCEDCIVEQHVDNHTDSLTKIVDKQRTALQERLDAAKNRSDDISSSLLTFFKLFCLITFLLFSTTSNYLIHMSYCSKIVCT